MSFFSHTDVRRMTRSHSNSNSSTITVEIEFFCEALHTAHGRRSRILIMRLHY
jgi:hypothetical protein